MKTTSTFVKVFIATMFCILIAVDGSAQISVNGEILADTNNVTVLKVWGTHKQRGVAHGYFLGDKILDIVNGYIRPRFGNFYPTARILVTDGENLVFDSIYHVEAKAMIRGMGYAGFDTTEIDYVDILVGNAFSDLGGYPGSKKSGSDECSTFLNWGDATAGTDLDGKSVITRSYDWGSAIPSIVDNAVIVIHIPSEEGLQPWLLVGYAGEFVPSGGGLNQGGISVYKNGMSDFPGRTAVMGAQYEPYQITMRRILETDDINGNGVNNTMDARVAFNSNPQGYATAHIISVLARHEGQSDGLTAMVAVITPIEPTHVYRYNSYDDSIPGDNLYAANSQIARNNAHHYCDRYINMLDHMGDGTGIGSQENWDLMKTYSLAGVNYGLMQHIPELDILNLSVYRNGMPAYMQEPTTFNLRDFFNRAPVFAVLPDTSAAIGFMCKFEIEVFDPDPYDEIIINAQQLPDWLTLVDHGDKTAILTGTPDTEGLYTVILTTTDGMESDTLEFEVDALITSVADINLDDIQVYPNPAHDRLFIQTDKALEVTLFSITGKQVLHEQILDPANGINISQLPGGIYFLRLRAGNEEVTMKVVKM